MHYGRYRMRVAILSLGVVLGFGSALFQFMRGSHACFAAPSASRAAQP